VILPIKLSAQSVTHQTREEPKNGDGKETAEFPHLIHRALVYEEGTGLAAILLRQHVEFNNWT
jgi:hypothetical protein